MFLLNATAGRFFRHAQQDLVVTIFKAICPCRRASRLFRSYSTKQSLHHDERLGRLPRRGKSANGFDVSHRVQRFSLAVSMVDLFYLETRLAARQFMRWIRRWPKPMYDGVQTLEIQLGKDGLYGL